MVRRMVIGGLVGTVLVTGCATKKFVQEEVAKSQERVGGDVGRVDRRLDEEKARIDGLPEGGRGDARRDRGGGPEGRRRRPRWSEQAAKKAEEATAKATDAASRADAAGATAQDALAKATETDQRLTKLWASRDKRTLTDTQVVLFGFDKWVLDDAAQTTLLALVKHLQDQPQLSVELEGFTDSTGISAYNIQLSQRRAEAVRRFLVEKGDRAAPDPQHRTGGHPARRRQQDPAGPRPEPAGGHPRLRPRGVTAGSAPIGAPTPGAPAAALRRGFLPGLPPSGILVEAGTRMTREAGRSDAAATVQDAREWRNWQTRWT